MEFNLPKIEKKILNFWKDNKIFERSIERRKKKPDFVFYEGPPTANGKPGIHHVLSRAFKDIICRYKTMQGFRVLRKAGWDTHGLPVELEIEKKLGLKSKKDIEKFGIAKFNQLCKKSVWAYKKDWEKLTERIAFWLDLKNPYITYETDYIETIWWIIKQIWRAGLIYQGHKVVPYCPRCGTALSSHEVALGYEKVKEKSVYIKFKILSHNPKWQGVSIFSWTTTPWTLPGNVALAVNPKFTYVKVKIKDEILVLSKERLSVLGKDYEIIDEISGKDLMGLEYEPLFDVSQLKSSNSYKIYPADFVTAEEGTGVVHTAVMYGEEDYDLGKKVGLPALHTVTEEGKFIKTLGEGLADLYVKSEKAETLIIEHLKKNNFLFNEEMYEHDYPFCWRCHSPLIYYAKQSWFINMQKVKKDLIEENEKINWMPAHLKEGRFGEWLKEIKDWAFSRERYWGTPLPVWQCKECKRLEFIGSLKDLLSQKFSRNSYFIVRHGESLRNKKNISACWPEKIYCPLTKKGEREVKMLAKKLKSEEIDLIFSSDLLRTRQTAEIVGKKLGLKPKVDKRLREVNVGTLNGKPIKELGRFWDKEGKLSPQKYYLERFKIAAPKGEDYVDIEKRMYGFIKETDKKYQGKNILIVSHQRPITLLEKVIYGYDFKKFVEITLRKKEIKTAEVKRLEFKNLPYNERMELDFHRPFIDEIKFYCKKCGEKKGRLMERVPEVIDCWFDSGSMPFAQNHWPFSQNQKSKIKNKKYSPPELFPADYISEAIDQTRGWFYTLLAISTLLGFGTSYKNVISLSHVLDKKGGKMSKSKGNIVDPWYIVDKYGADSTRWYFYTINQPGDAKLFSEKDIEGALKRFIMILWNCFVFYNTYAERHGNGQKNIGANQRLNRRKPTTLLDEWIISRFNTLIQETTERLGSYDVTGAARAVENFVIEDLSQWHIRRSRGRFQRPETKKDIKEASQILGFVLLTLSKLTAPFIPFLSEEIYQKIQNQKSRSRNFVHLEDWPKANKKLINKKLEEKMKRIREVVTLSLAERVKAGIKVRQPLAKLTINNYGLRKDKELLELIKNEVNVKEIVFDKKIKNKIELDAKITPELKEEGMIREIIRNIQEMRKKAGLKPKDKILVQYYGTPVLNKILLKNKESILKEAKVKDLILKRKERKSLKGEKKIEVDNQKLWLTID